MNAPSDLAGLRVLIVEDEAILSIFLEDVLTEAGCEIVATASRFGEAMTKACSLSFDVATLDVNFNGEQSLPIAHELASRGITFVFATGYGSNLPSDAPEAPVLHKPFEFDELARALRQAVEGPGARRA